MSIPAAQKKQLTQEERRAKINKALGCEVIYNDFSQAQFEKYQKATLIATRAAYVAFESGGGGTADAELRGESVREALRLGILSGFEVEKIGELKPYVVNWMAEELKAHVISITTEPISPN